MNLVFALLAWGQNHWPTLLQLAGGGVGLSILVQIILHKFHVDSKKVAYTVTHLLGLAAALSAYVLANQNVIGDYAGIVIAAQTVHRFVVSPYYEKYIVPYLNYLQENATVSAPAQPTVVETPQPEAAPAFVG